MSRVEDFALFESVHSEALALLPDAEAAVRPLRSAVRDVEVREQAVQPDPHLTTSGKVDAMKSAKTAANAVVDTWSTPPAVDAQRSALAADVSRRDAAAAPTYSAEQVAGMVAMLTPFDAVELGVLYADASDGEQRLMEAAAILVGRRPVKRTDGLPGWERLLDTERVELARERRMAAAFPAEVAKLRDLDRVLSALRSLASAARQLIMS